MASSEGELFALKLKLQHYEQRLRQVNLHGSDGEQLVQQNKAYASRIQELESQGAQLDQANKELLVIVSDSEECMGALQKDAEKYRAQSEERQRALDELKAQCEVLGEAKDTAEANYVQATSLFQEQEARLGSKLEESQHEVERLTMLHERATVETGTWRRKSELAGVELEELRGEVRRLREREVKLDKVSRDLQGLEKASAAQAKALRERDREVERLRRELEASSTEVGKA